MKSIKITKEIVRGAIKDQQEVLQFPKVLSLFDGMSVAQQALKELGVPVATYYASEIDKYAIAVTQSNFPDTVQLGDVCQFSDMVCTGNWLELVSQKVSINNRPDFIDLMVGGSPCQDLSIAKKNRKGLTGDRSALFWEYVKIRDEVKPKYFILENVASMPRESKETISEALGVEPVMINASLVSAQNRKRYFWVGKWNGEKYEQVEIPQPEDKGILLKDILEDGVDEKYYIDVSKNDRIKGWTENERGIRPHRGDKAKTGISELGRITNTDQKSDTVSTNHSPTIRIGSLNSGGQGDRIYSTEGKSTNLNANGGGGGAKTGLYAIEPVALRNRGEGKKPEYNGTGKANAMTSIQTDSMVEENMQIRKLTPTECLRLQSMPDDYFDKADTTRGKTDKQYPISNTQRYKMCGNAFNCEVVKHIIRHLNETNPTNTPSNTTL